MPAIQFVDGFRFASHVERVTSPSAANEFERLLLHLVGIAQRATGINVLAEAIEILEQPATVPQSIRRDFRR